MSKTQTTESLQQLHAEVLAAKDGRIRELEAALDQKAERISELEEQSGHDGRISLAIASKSTRLAGENHALREEIEALRSFGNKGCTAKADEHLAKERQRRRDEFDKRRADGIVSGA